ncbi:hypothetical protein ACHAWF_014123 [Thalassiosira exigua]
MAIKVLPPKIPRSEGNSVKDDYTRQKERAGAFKLSDENEDHSNAEDERRRRKRRAKKKKKKKKKRLSSTKLGSLRRRQKGRHPQLPCVYEEEELSLSDSNANDELGPHDIFIRLAAVASFPPAASDEKSKALLKAKYIEEAAKAERAKQRAADEATTQEVAVEVRLADDEAKLKRMEDQLEYESRQNVALTDQIAMLQLDIQAAKAKQKKVDQANVLLEIEAQRVKKTAIQKIIDSRSELNSMETRLSHKEKETGILKEQISKLNAEILSRKTQQEALDEDAKRVKNKAEFSINAKTEELKGLELRSANRGASFEAQIAQLSEQIRTAKLQQQALDEKAQQAKARAEKKITEQMNELLKMEERFRSASEQNNTLSKNISALKAGIESARGEQVALDDANVLLAEEAQETKEKAEKEIKIMSNELKKMEANLQAAAMQNSAFENEINKLKRVKSTDRRAYQKTIDAQNNQLLEMQKASDSQNIELQKLYQVIESLQAEIGEERKLKEAALNIIPGDFKNNKIPISGGEDSALWQPVCDEQESSPANVELVWKGGDIYAAPISGKEVDDGKMVEFLTSDLPSNDNLRKVGIALEAANKNLILHQADRKGSDNKKLKGSHQKRKKNFYKTKDEHSEGESSLEDACYSDASSTAISMASFVAGDASTVGDASSAFFSEGGASSAFISEGGYYTEMGGKKTGWLQKIFRSGSQGSSKNSVASHDSISCGSSISDLEGSIIGSGYGGDDNNTSCKTVSQQSRVKNKLKMKIGTGAQKSNPGELKEKSSQRKQKQMPLL